MFGCLEKFGCLDVGMFGGSEVSPARSTSDGSADKNNDNDNNTDNKKKMNDNDNNNPPTHRWSSVLGFI